MSRAPPVVPPKLEPRGYFRRVPLAPHQLCDRVTRTQDAIVLCHLGIARFAREQWALDIEGLVERPLTLTFGELARYPRTELVSIHQCAGSPLQPFEPTRRICNVQWGGVRLADVLADCRPKSSAQYIWCSGADCGEFGGVVVDDYTKDIPIARVHEDVLLAYEMNGDVLAPEHGFPVRLVVPGYYGTNSVKWLTRIVASAKRAPGPFTTRWYNDPVLTDSGATTDMTAPVWSIAPESLIVSPAPDEPVRLSAGLDVWGWAWADGGVRSVAVCFDNEWVPAELETPLGRQWQRFAVRCVPKRRGPVTLASRAEATNGATQPLSGRRNAVYSFPVTVV